MAKKMPKMWMDESSGPWINLLLFLHYTVPAFVILSVCIFVFFCGFCFNGANEEEAILELRSWAGGVEVRLEHIPVLCSACHGKGALLSRAQRGQRFSQSCEQAPGGI